DRQAGGSRSAQVQRSIAISLIRDRIKSNSLAGGWRRYGNVVSAHHVTCRIGPHIEADPAVGIRLSFVINDGEQRHGVRVEIDRDLSSLKSHLDGVPNCPDARQFSLLHDGEGSAVIAKI